jgi:hypothetical protein
MCGDPYCFSCSIAYGNAKCEVCGAYPWDGGCTDPGECQRKAQEADAALDAIHASIEKDGVQ